MGMFRVDRFFRTLYQRLLLGKKVYALVGPAGTGKSFRAQLIAQKVGATVIVDDGLIIRGESILGGTSAKDQSSGYRAVRTAIFADPGHALASKRILSRLDFKKILLLGTSDRMILTIADRLGLPHPVRTIYIDEIATEVEIEAARLSRRRTGKHIIPVPVVEVLKKPRNIFMVPIHVLLNRGLPLRRRTRFEKTVVKPEYSNRGKVLISHKALTQMVCHCVEEYDSDLKVLKVVIGDEWNSYDLEVVLEVPYESRMGGHLHGLQRYLLDSLEHFAGIDVTRINVTVGQVREPSPEEEAGEGGGEE